MKRFLKPLLVVGVVILVAVIVVWFVFPEWRANPVGPGVSGFTLVLGIFASVFSIIKSTVAPKEPKPGKPSSTQKQVMRRSDNSEQTQTGGGTDKSQTMVGSNGSKQNQSS